MPRHPYRHERASLEWAPIAPNVLIRATMRADAGQRGHAILPPRSSLARRPPLMSTGVWHPRPVAVEDRIRKHVPRCAACREPGTFLAAAGRYRFVYGCERCGVHWAARGIDRWRHLLAAAWPRCPRHLGEMLDTWVVTAEEGRKGTGVGFQGAAHGVAAAGAWLGVTKAATTTEVDMLGLIDEMVAGVLRGLGPTAEN